MGSKTPLIKEKPSHACNLCELKFQTRQALRTHKTETHKHPSLEATPEADQKMKLKKITPRASKRLQLKKSSAQDTDESDNSDTQNTEENVNKTEFSCPKCEKVFPIFFQALRHIQKKHCVDEYGNPVSPDSPDIVKPVTFETCSNCRRHASSLHNCNSISDATLDKFYNSLFCLACEEQFSTIALFNKHASNRHNANVDSMYFKTVEEFNLWKQLMECQVKIKYLALNKPSTQTYYQCNYVSPKNDFNKTYLCPSLLFAKEFNTGIQVHYYKDHHGHKTPKYELPEEFSQNLSNKKQPKTEFDLLVSNEDEDLYIKFKDLLKNISSYAAKLKKSQLKNLFKLALEMQGLLNSYDEDQNDKDASLISKVMSDDQITDALEDKRSSARLKRKSETRSSVEAKQKKVDTVSENSKIRNEEKSSKTKENKELESPDSSSRSSPILQSPSFNDTYKQFLNVDQESTKNTSKNTKRKEIVKTKMGQFSPKKKIVSDEKTGDPILRRPNILKPSITNTTFIKDIKYEVKEQENDCNILILKI